jgi:autotransporter translocation and assembly factor TamB
MILEAADMKRAQQVRGFRALALLVSVVMIGGATLGAQGKVDVTGKWALEVVTEAGGTTTPSVTLKQQGEKLSGHYSSQTLGEAEVTGSIKGQNITFSLTGNAQGQSIEVTYTGTVDGNSMKGKITLGGLGEGTFTGERQ